MEEKKINENEQNIDLFDDLEGEEDVIGSLSTHKKQEITFKTKLLGFLLIISLILICILGIGYYFISLSLRPVNSLNPYEVKYVNTIKFLLVNFLGNKALEVDLSSTNPTQKAEKMFEYINSPGVLFYDKIAFKEKQENKFYQNVNVLWKKLVKYKSLIEKYKFFPQELQDIVKDIRVLPILTALNSIKLYITDYVFMKAGLFNDKIFSFVYPRNIFSTKYSDIPSAILKERLVSDLQFFKDKGAYIYLSTVYFNYMYTDTDKLSKLFFTKKFISTFKDRLNETFVSLRNYIPFVSKDTFIVDYVNLIKSIYSRTIDLQDKEKTEILPVDVRLLNYNPSNQQLQFVIKLMLSPDLMAKIDPVQLFSDIVTLLRESRLIIGKQIVYNSLKVKKIFKRIAGYKITLFTAEQKFSTLVQPKVLIEVTDTNY